MEVAFTSTSKRVELCIRDNGVGFDPASVKAGLGLTGMRERAEKVGASLKLTSHVGQGTQIKLVWRPPQER